MRQSQSSVLPETGPGRESTRPPRGRSVRRPLVERIAGWSARHRKTAVFGWLALVAVIFVAGQSITAKNVPQYDPGQSGAAEQALARLHDNGPPPAEDVLIQARGSGTFDSDPQLRQATRQVVSALRRLPRQTASGIRSPFSPDGRSLVSADGRSVLVSFNVTGVNEDEAVVPALHTVAAVQARYPGLRIAETGDASADRVINALVSRDFRKAESTSLPVTLILLVAVFGALIAAGIPLLLAGTAVISAISLTSVIGQWLPTGSSTSEVVLIIGMAVGIDYSLFYLRREREERAKGRSTSEALRIAAGTSGEPSWSPGSP
jgi:putative drug exporter of the RND superfamily